MGRHALSEYVSEPEVTKISCPCPSISDSNSTPNSGYHTFDFRCFEGWLSGRPPTTMRYLKFEIGDNFVSLPNKYSHENSPQQTIYYTYILIIYKLRYCSVPSLYDIVINELLQNQFIHTVCLFTHKPTSFWKYPPPMTQLQISRS